jgi:hypothetical protein
MDSGSLIMDSGSLIMDSKSLIIDSGSLIIDSTSLIVDSWGVPHLPELVVSPALWLLCEVVLTWHQDSMSGLTISGKLRRLRPAARVAQGPHSFCRAES